MILGRLKNLWKLSEYAPDTEPHIHEEKPVGTHIAMIVRKPAKFIAYSKRDPIKEITEEQP